MGKDEFLKLLENAASARDAVDDECKVRLAENQLTVLNRKLNEIKTEKERVFQTMADAIMVGKNQLEAYLKIENGINAEIKNLEKEIKDVQRGV